MSTPPDVTESGPADSPAGSEVQPQDQGARPRFSIVRVMIWVAAAAVLLVVAGGVFVWRSLTAIPKVPIDQEVARERIGAVTDDELAELQENAARVEADIANAQALEDGDPEQVNDPDLLVDSRAALEGRDVNDFEVPFSQGIPVPDEVFDSYLLIGSDLSEALADVIIYVLLPRQGGDPILASLPRDLYLPNPCIQQNSRINAALNGCGEFANGPELLGLMVEGYTGVPVDHFAIVNFEGFTEVIDAFGGLELCVEHPVRDSKSFLSLPAGCTQADGETVLQWVRSRSTQELVDGVWRTQEGVDDFVRQQRQQDVLLEIASKLGSFSSIGGITEVVNGLAGAVTFDDNLSVPGIIQTAWDLRRIDLATINRVSVEYEGYRTDHGAFVEVPAESFSEALEEATVEVDTTEAS